MKKVIFALAAALLLTLSVAAQITTDGPYKVNYFANRGNAAGADQTLRIINDGVLGSPLSPNDARICANIYVFDALQEMEECCSCTITANGLLTLSVNNDLTQNPLTGLPAPDSGVIKIVSTIPAPGCNEQGVAGQVLTPGLQEWQGHLESPLAGTFVTAVNEYAPSTLSATELGFLGQACSFVQYLGSGKGKCTCGAGSH